MQGGKRGKAKVDTQIKDLEERETLAHYSAVRVEDLLSKMDYVIERVESLEESLRGEIRDMREEMNRRFGDIEIVVKNHSALLRALA